jgi:hypothetical protein
VMLHCSAVSVIVLGLMVLGTAYDLYLVHQSRHFFSKNYTYEITRASTPHLGVGPIKLEVGNFIQTTTSHANEGVINHGTLPDCQYTVQHWKSSYVVNRLKASQPSVDPILWQLDLL